MVKFHACHSLRLCCKTAIYRFNIINKRFSGFHMPAQQCIPAPVFLYSVLKQYLVPVFYKAQYRHKYNLLFSPIFYNKIVINQLLFKIYFDRI